jgi:hypothetical protein
MVRKSPGNLQRNSDRLQLGSKHVISSEAKTFCRCCRFDALTRNDRHRGPPRPADPCALNDRGPTHVEHSQLN